MQLKSPQWDFEPKAKPLRLWVNLFRKLASRPKHLPFLCVIKVCFVRFKTQSNVELFDNLFSGDEIRRLVTETIIPFVSESVSQWRIKRQFCKIHKMSKVQEQVREKNYRQRTMSENIYKYIGVETGEVSFSYIT